MPERDRIKARTFFLNETHELGAVEKPGGGRVPEYVGISWAKKAKRISSSIQKVLHDVESSRDPLRSERYFVVAKPVAALEKKSKDKKKAPEGTYQEQTAFGGAHGKVFDRLDLDLLQVTSTGQAVVHGTRERVEQLLERSKSLEALGVREQARWVTIDAFETVPVELRVDGEWLATLKPDQPSDVVFELQPVLGRVDADRVLRAIADLLQGQERLTGTGTDFSGRFWFRGKATKGSVRSIARDFFSVQSIHPPLYSFAAATKPASRISTAPRRGTPLVAPDPRILPCVAILDLGVPSDHVQLAPYRRGQFVAQQASTQTVSDHGSFVASRVVFGNWATADELHAASGRCAFYDVVVGEGYMDRINDKVIMSAMAGVRGAAPDVRVFNFSFGDIKPLRDFTEVEQREKRLLLQDLDNFVFANDIVVVVAAGNAQAGLMPDPAYPQHYDDPRWALGSWACGFNTMVCGSFVGQVSASGLVQNAGWPSPFSRIGPGLCDAPVPSFGAEGGNSDYAHNGVPGLGVWGFSGVGLAEDRVGTSHAAPLLAREAALGLSILQQHCAPNTQPFGVMVRALLALTAEKTADSANVSILSERTLGFGKASSNRLAAPANGSAVILWQGIIETAKDVVRVELPIPPDWLDEAEEPMLRFFVCYDPPVNEAAKALWACRRVHITLHPGPEARGIRGIRTPRQHESYSLYQREFKLKQYGPNQEKAAAGVWVLELYYDDIFDYPPGLEFDSRQRVAFAAELVDRGSSPVDPQVAMQALPNVASMNRLSIQPTPVRTPIVIRTRT